MTSIAKRFRVSIAAIVTRNHLPNPDRLADGQLLVIPPRPPLGLTVTPRAGPPGQAFVLNLTGTKPAETIVFEVDSPTGTFRGGAHTASADGAVSATYQTASGDRPGLYTAIARGNQGTTAKVVFSVVATTTDHT